MPTHVQTYNKGIDKDSSVYKYPNNTAYHIENFRFITDEGLTTMSLENSKGTLELFSLDTGYLFWGYVIIRDTLVILAINSSKVGDAATDKIYTATIPESGYIASAACIYTGALGLSLTYRINSVIGRYESEDLQKIYWADGNQQLKFANIADPSITTKDPSWFDYIPAFDISTIAITSVGNGLLKTGKVQYAYQLYNLYGAATNFSALTKLVPLTPYGQTGNDGTFTGGAVETNSGKSISISISNIDDDFNRIRVVRILHTSLLNDPEITIIYDSTVSSTFTMIDDGTHNYGTLSAAEFNFETYRFIPTYLETKNNLLFASNVKEEIWDVDYDARAYRFMQVNPSTYRCDITDESQSTTNHIYFSPEDLTTNNRYFNHSGVAVSGPIPETHDCIIYTGYTGLPYGPSAYERNSSGNYGGTGKNLSYDFVTTPIKSYGDVNEIVNNTQFGSSDTSILAISDGAGYMRGETYSFGLVLINTAGQKSYVKWVGDIKFPTMRDSSTFNTCTYSGTSVYSNYLYIRFNIDASKLPADCAYVQIVRCERTANDRTILAQGLLSATANCNRGSWQEPSMTVTTIKDIKDGYQVRGSSNFTLSSTLYNFISPEINYGNNIEYLAGDLLKPMSALILKKQYYKLNNKGAFTYNKFVDIFVDDPNFSFNSPSDLQFIVSNTGETSMLDAATTVSISIDDFKICSYSNNPPDRDTDPIVESMSVTVDSVDYENYIRGFGTDNLQGVHGTVGVLNLSNTLYLANENVNTNRKYIIANYVRNIVPYGGASYAARANREYIPVSDIISKASLTLNSVIAVKNGDTYIPFFEYQRIMITGMAAIGMLEKDESWVDVVKFPVETSINTRWQTNKTWTQEYCGPGNIPINPSAALMQEVAGYWAKDDAEINEAFTQKLPLYSYNSVYSKQNNLKKFYPEPADALSTITNDVRIHYSDRKYNNESVDSWTIWRALNFKDVDGNYGPINATICYNHDFIFFQDRGIGMASIEEREMVQSTTGSTALIGQGGILSRYDYFYTNGGCQDNSSIVVGNYGLYWYCRYNNGLFCYTKERGVENLSKLHGLYSFFNTISAATISTVVSGVSRRFNEIYFTLHVAGGDYYTIVFDEVQQIFTQFVTLNSDKYFDYNNYMYSVNVDNEIHLNNVGPYGQFHGTIYPSKLTFIINPRQMLINKFDVLEFVTKVVFGGAESQETFTTLRVRDSYQDTNVITLTNNDDLTQRFRTWRFNMLRDSDEYMSTLQDNYVQVDLEFTNDGNKHIVLSDLIMLYQESFNK